MSKLTKGQSTGNLDFGVCIPLPFGKSHKVFPPGFSPNANQINKTYSSQRIEYLCVIADKMPIRCCVSFIPFHLLGTLAVACGSLKDSLA